jgi:surface polysaccharide O-acyltransferase-like enzyme
LTLIPLYKIIFLYSRGLPQEALHTYFHFFSREGGRMWFYADNPTMNWLWFLPVLFVFQIIYLIMSKTKLLKINISLKWAVFLVFLLGTIYSYSIAYLDQMGWYHSALIHFQRERLFVYFLAFLLGSLCYKLKVFSTDNKNIKFFVLSNVTLAIALSVFTAVSINYYINSIEENRNYFFISDAVDGVIYFASMLLSMLSILHVLIHTFRYYLNKTNSLLAELSRNSYYVYIIHVVVMGLIALVMINLEIAPAFKFIILTSLTYIISNILVSGYKGVFSRPLSKKNLMTSTVLALMVILAFNTRVNSAAKEKEVTVNQKKVVAKMSLHEAALFGNAEQIRIHIANGININQKDDYGSTALIIACTFGKPEVAKELINAGADLNLPNNEGSTPLHIAAFFGRVEIVEELLVNGADKNIRNGDNMLAYETVTIPFESIRGIYDHFISSLGPLGLKLNYDELQKNRVIIAKMLK